MARIAIAIAVFNSVHMLLSGATDIVSVVTMATSAIISYFDR
jgi:hypothetical protein